MKEQHLAWTHLHNEKLRQIPYLQRYGKHYIEYLIGSQKANFIQRLRKQLTIFPAELIDIIELLAEQNIQSKLKHQELNIYERNMFDERNKHLNNEKYWYINSYRLMKDDLFYFFYYLKSYIDKPKQQYHLKNNIDKKTLLILSAKLAKEIANKYFQKENVMADINDVNSFDYRITQLCWTIGRMFITVKNQGVLSLLDIFDKNTKDNLMIYLKATTSIIVDGHNLATISLKLEFIYLDFMKDLSNNADDIKLAYFIKTNLPFIINMNISDFLNLASSVLTTSSMQKLCDFFQQAGLINE